MGSLSYLSTLVTPLLSLIHPTSLSFPPLSAQSIHPPTTSALSAIHIAALDCLSNVFLSFATAQNSSVLVDLNSGLTVWNGIWSALRLVGTETGPGQERRQEFWDVSIGVLWGVGRVWKGCLVSCARSFGTELILFEIPDEENINVLIQLCNATSDSRLRVKCLGTLECLAQTPTAIESNRVKFDSSFFLVFLNV